MPSDPVLALSFTSPVTVKMTRCGREAEKLWRVQRAILQTLPMSYMLSRLYHNPGTSRTGYLLHAVPQHFWGSRSTASSSEQTRDRVVIERASSVRGVVI